MERAVTRQLVTSLLAQGLALSVEYGEGREMFPTRNAETVNAMLHACDEEQLAVWKAADGGGEPVCIGYVFLVYGNDGYDTVSDYHTSLEPYMGEANRYAEELDKGEVSVCYLDAADSAAARELLATRPDLIEKLGIF